MEFKSRGAQLLQRVMAAVRGRHAGDLNFEPIVERPGGHYDAAADAEVTPPRHPDLDEPPIGSKEFREFVRRSPGEGK